MTPKELEEAVARAIDAHLAANLYDMPGAARAALAVVREAMREPTPGMLGAFWRYKNGHHFHDEPAPSDTSDYGAYRAMLYASPLGEEAP